MLIARTIHDLRKALARYRGRKIGFVPTMGDLHEGHLSLIRRSRKENEVTALSIFVNPAQFDRKEDFAKYRRNEKSDLEKAMKEKVDLVFLPAARQLYPAHYQTWVSVAELSEPLCGRYRPGHFKGVATIVLKLCNLIQPAAAYFGMKDYQQFRVIGQMARDLHLPVRIVPCPIVREANGLALSSRNSRLSPAEKTRAGRISSALQGVADLLKSGQKLAQTNCVQAFRKNLRPGKNDKIEYLGLADPVTLKPLKRLRPPVLIAAAVWIGRTRLIDNCVLFQ